MPNLYEINNEILACLDLDTGEILDVEKLEALNIEKSQKIENIACLIKNQRADAKAIAEEVKSLTERMKRTERGAERLERYLSDALVGENFSTRKCAVSFRRSERVEITDEAQIPREFIKTSTAESVDKVAIKAAIKAGRAVDGCQLIKNLNISVK